MAGNVLLLFSLASAKSRDSRIMACTPTAKKRKVTEEGRLFQEKWKESYFFTCVKGKAVCLICREAVAVLKECNVKRHYETKHASVYDEFLGQFRKDKLGELNKALSGQQGIFTRQQTESETHPKFALILRNLLQ